jgi:asparagine synthase (glutamine-hydrolysing)
MPGVVGLITKMPQERAEAQVRRMISALMHESFYVSGTWSDAGMGCYAGWVAKQGSFSDGMPVCNERGSVTLIFSGQEFPYPGTKRNLREQGHDFENEGPSYLVHLYEEDGSFPACLNGQFHGIVADRARGTVTLFNDRYGMHRLYYYESDHGLYFASEAKAILTVCLELRKIDDRGLGEFITCGCVMENRTIFRNVNALPPASAWVFQNGGIERRAQYFEPSDWEKQQVLEPERYYLELREVFARNLGRYFNGRERIGMSLTGGLDTRLIMAWQKFAPGEMPCYSFGGPFRDCQDVILAQRVARMCGQPHQVIPLGKDFLSRFPQYAERTVFLTDGCASVSQACDLYANERARDLAPVRMTGNYGSEVLRRLAAFKPVAPSPGLFRRDILPYIEAARKTYAELRRGHAVSFVAFRQLPTHHYGILALEESQVSVRSPFVDNDLVRTAFRAPDAAIVRSDIFADNNDCIRLIGDGDAALRRLPTDRGLAGGSMFRRLLLEFTFKAEYAYDYGMPQWLARIDHRLSRLHLERLFLGRHKFYHYRVWYRDALSGYVREMLLDSRTLSRPYLDGKRLKEIVAGHLKGDRNYTTEIHKVLSLELLHRLFVDR